MAEPPPWWHSASTSMMQSIVESNKKEIKAELAPVIQGLSECKTRLTSVETKQTDMEKRIESLERSKEGSAPAAAFEASFVKIKGFCDFSDMKEKGVTRVQASELMMKLKAALPEDLQVHVKDFELRGAKNYNIKVPISPKYLKEILHSWRDQFAMPENHWMGNELRVTPEMPPEVSKRYAMTGRVKDFVSDNCDAGANVRAFWGPDFQIYLEPNEIEAAQAVQPILIATVGPDSVIEWGEDLSGIGCVNSGDAGQKVLKFKRK